MEDEGKVMIIFYTMGLLAPFLFVLFCCMAQDPIDAFWMTCFGSVFFSVGGSMIGHCAANILKYMGM